MLGNLKKMAQDAAATATGHAAALTDKATDAVSAAADQASTLSGKVTNAAEGVATSVSARASTLVDSVSTSTGGGTNAEAAAYDQGLADLYNAVYQDIEPRMESLLGKMHDDLRALNPHR